MSAMFGAACPSFAREAGEAVDISKLDVAEGRQPAGGTTDQPQRLAPAAVSVGVPNLNISPKRLIFDGKSRIASVNLFNRGTAPVTVDIALVDNVMLGSGEIVPLAEAARRGGEAADRASRVKGARTAILATPSRMTLAPGKGRTVRLQARPTEVMTAVPGEYRTHLTVTTVPAPTSGLTAEQAASAGSADLSINVQSIFGISIPLILRTGPLTASARFGAMSLSTVTGRNGAVQPALLVPIGRTGDRSLYGNIEVRAGQGKGAPLLGSVRGLGVYSELEMREVRVPIERAPRPGETLWVTYVSDEDSRAELLASGRFPAR